MFPAMATGVTEITAGGLGWVAGKYGKDEPVATVYGDFDTTRFTMALRLAAAKAVGLASTQSPVNSENNTYNPLGQADWRPTADTIINKTDPAAKGVLFSGQPLDLGKLITALGAEGAGGAKGHPEWVFADENNYDQVVIQNGRSGLAKVPLYVQSFIYPFEEAGRGAASKGMDDFLALFDKYLPNGKSHAMFAVSGFASWLLFAQTATACGDTLSRACLETQVRKIGTFDAGGLIAPRDPAKSQRSSQCYVLLRATPEGFERVADVKPTPDGNGVFNCSPTNLANVSTDEAMREWIDKAASNAKVPAG